MMKASEIRNEMRTGQGVRIVWCAAFISEAVEGFRWSREWRVEGVLKENVQEWREKEERAREEDEMRQTRRWVEDIDEEGDSISEGNKEDDKGDSGI